MTPSDPLLTRLTSNDPARHLDLDEAHARALLELVRVRIACDEPPTRRSKRRPTSLQLSRRLPVAIAVMITALVLVGIALNLSHRSLRQRAASPPRRVVTSSQQSLLDILGVLRRPQTPRDRKGFAQSGIEGFAQSGIARASGLFANLGAIDAASARVATTTPWGTPVVLAMVRLNRSGQEGLLEWIGHSGGGGPNATEVEAGDDVSIQSWGATYAGGSTGVREEAIVPDGVARVAFVFPQSAGDRAPGPSYPKPLRVTVKVHGNVAAVEARRSGATGTTPMIWYAADGQVIKEIGNPTTAARPTTHPTPTPPTTRSQAAQRDPATPNLVTVTPHSGSSSTTFRISWRLLLTGAVYQFTATGPQGAGCYGANSLPGGLSGGTTNVRGQAYGEALGPLRGHGWCPGTYRVFVNVLSFGTGRPTLHPTPQPFGAVTFTVR